MKERICCVCTRATTKMLSIEIEMIVFVMNFFQFGHRKIDWNQINTTFEAQHNAWDRIKQLNVVLLFDGQRVTEMKEIGGI